MHFTRSLHARYDVAMVVQSLVACTRVLLEAAWPWPDARLT